jgi:hypothetical protein
MRWGVVASGVIALLAAADTGSAHADTMPKGRLAGVIGLRNGTQSLNDAFGMGFLYGVEAAWEPLPDGRRFGYAIVWNVLFGNFGEDPAAITGSLDIVEMNLGLRARFAPRDPARSLFIGGGPALLRANAPLPPDNERSYVGGFVGFGLEQLALDKALITLELRYGLINGPGSLSVLLGIGFGV